MRGHELRRAGRIEDAIEEFRTANNLESAYYRAEHIPAQYDWHRAHNLNLLAMCHQLLGQMKVAEQLLRESFSLPGHGELAEFGRKQWPEFLLARGQAQEAFEQADILAQSPSMMARFAGHTLKGRALVAMKRVDDAQKEMDLARDALILIPASDADRLRPYSDTLRAEILLAEKKSAEGVALMKEIEQEFRASPGPDARSQALVQLDSIARWARETKEWFLAELTAEQMIEQDPSYAGGYYAKGLVAEHEGNSGLATQQFGIAEKLWGEADKDLPELVMIRNKLTSEQSKLSQTRQEYLKQLRERGATWKPAQTSKVELSFDLDRLRGSAQAPVIIIEFSDFQCPFCRSVQPTLKSLLAKYDGKVSLAYRDFPLRGMHGQAELGAESSRCAGEQRKFWEYHDLLFANPDKLNRPGLLELARRLRLDEVAFESCLSSGKHRADVEKDLQDGIRAGVMGTPSIFINGTLLSGAQAESVFARLIEAELANVEKKSAAN
jgi:protein-disulfide isomerase